MFSPLQVSKAGDLELTVQVCTQLNSLEGVLAQRLGWSEPLQATQLIFAFLGSWGVGFLAAQSESDFCQSLLLTYFPVLRFSCQPQTLLSLPPVCWH